MPIRPMQGSFAGGEYSPSLYARTDIQKYLTGLRTCRNFIIHPHGGASNRSGFKYVANQKSNSTRARVVPFIFNQDQAYVLEFGDTYVRFHTDGGQIESGGSPYEIVSPYSADDLDDLSFEASADVIYVLHPDYQTRTLSRLGDTNWVFALYEPEDGPFMSENITTTTMNASAVSGLVSMSASASTFDSLHEGALFKLRHYVEGQAISSSFSSATSSSSIKCFTTWRLITHGTWTAKFNIEKSTDGGSTWTVLRSFSGAADFNANTSGTEDIDTNEDPFLVRINVTSYTSGTLNVDLTTDPFYQEGIVQMLTYHSATSFTATVLQELAAVTGTTQWSEGSWSDYRGWPSRMRFYKDRAVFASTYAEPMTEWMTRLSNYTSFKRNQQLLDTDGITTVLQSRQLNAINGMVAFKQLITLTSASEWAVGPSSGSALTPTTVQQDVQGYRGSSGVEPAVIGNEAIYVQSNGKTIRNLSFSFQDDSFVGSDINILARHLFEDHSITQIAYQQDPDSIVWCLRSDGVLLALTYMREQEVVAWAWHDTDGIVESICVIPADGYDELWISVNRDGTRTIERMVERMASSEPEDQFFVDSGITYDVPVTISAASHLDPATITCSVAHGFSNGDLVDITDVLGMTDSATGESAVNGLRFQVINKTSTDFQLGDEETGVTVNSSTWSAYLSSGYVRKAFTTFSGLNHLEGKTVSILGDGFVFPQQEVSSGQITLSRACSRVHAGLQYLSDLETLNIEVPLKDGTAQGRKIKIGHVIFRFIKSRGGYIGPDSTRLYEGFIPPRASLGTPPDLYTGDKRQPLGGGYEDGARIFFRQQDPLPVTISAVIPEINIGGPSG